VSFDLQPTLVGHLITLRPLRGDDYAAMFAAASDPLIWEQHPAHDRYQEPVFRKLFDELLASRGALVVVENATERLIGWSRYHGYDPAKDEVEIGWTFLARRYWGGRYNGEMKRLMLAHAFRHVGRVMFVIGVDNIRSQRAVERIGAVFAERTGDGKVIYDIRRDRAGAGGARPADAIHTERLLLHRWRVDHAPLLKDAIDSNLEHLQRWMPWAMSEPTPLELLRERLGGFSENFDSGAEWLYGIFRPDGSRLIGGTGLHPRIGATGLEIGYWLRADETGRGYATEAASALTAAALSLPHVDHVEIRCDPRNAASAAIPQRLGYRLAETLVNEDGRDTMVWRRETE
jgi:RimJ/RimL family protein N-acetyltransferase